MKDLPHSGISPAVRRAAMSPAMALIDQSLAAQTVALAGTAGRIRPAVAESPAPLRRMQRPGQDAQDSAFVAMGDRRR